jgi:predicted aspartyl protease
LLQAHSELVTQDDVYISIDVSVTVMLNWIRNTARGTELQDRPHMEAKQTNPQAHVATCVQRYHPLHVASKG